MDKIQQKLNEMMGSLINYRGRDYLFHEWTVMDGQVHIEADKDTVTINKSEIEQELEKMKFANGEAVNSVVKRKQTQIQEHAEDIKSLNKVDDILLDTIEKLRSDDGKEYVDRAKAINSSVSTLISGQKVKLQFAKECRKLKE